MASGQDSGFWSSSLAKEYWPLFQVDLFVSFSTKATSPLRTHLIEISQDYFLETPQGNGKRKLNWFIFFLSLSSPIKVKQ